LSLPPRYFLFAGRFVQAKGVFDLLTAYATLPEELRHDVGLVLVGDGEELDELRRRSRGITPGNVLFPGFLQRDDLPAVYALAEALVFPTHTDPWGLVVNEALACGLPVIASDVAGCVADLVRERENGFVVAPRDTEALSRAMLELASAPGLRCKMSHRSREIGSHFTPQMWADGIVRAVTSTLGTRHG
jgi:glycosyltransferase involved in cell wall biosynthesis